jgi:hypothetical protein
MPANHEPDQARHMRQVNELVRQGTKLLSWWLQDAGRLQSANRESEKHQPDGYGAADVRRSIVHAREDISLIVSLLDSANIQLNSANIQLRQIKWTLVLIALALIYLCFKAH